MLSLNKFARNYIIKRVALSRYLKTLMSQFQFESREHYVAG